MKVSLLLSLFLFISCSGGSQDASVSAGLSISQQQAQKLIQNDIKALQNDQYGINASDLAALQKEGLVSKEEMNSLYIIK